MSNRPKELFEPGELSKTRRNIGAISPQEAKKMAKILGGEVGIERTADHINKRYKEFAEQNRRKEDYRLLYPSKQGVLRSSTEETPEQPLKTTPIETVAQSYFQRIKLSLIAYHGDYRIKSFLNVISALFSFLPGYRNKINPAFIKTLHARVYRHIEQFTSSTRFLYASVEKKDILERKNPYLWSIIKIIIEWDIESLEKEIFRLKTFSHAVSVEACSSLIKRIYVPIILFSRVNTEQDIKNALEYLYAQSIFELPERHVKITKLRKQYVRALEEINTIFKQIKFNLYPLLLLLVSPKAYSYHDMLKYQGKRILSFLELKTEDLVSYEKFSQLQEQEREEKQENTSREEKQKGPDEEPPIDIGITQGLFFLENLFPGTGWLKLKNKPDMFPGFQFILDLPSDFALITPDDILQKVIILTAILKEFFFGFRSVEYGFIRDEKGNTRDLKDIMEEITDNWYLFLTTLIEKNYITSLTEYCRQLERDGTFINSDYAQRMEADLLWLRKKYIFPHLSLDIPKILQPRMTLSVPKLYKNTEILKNILQRMVLELWNDNGIPIETIRNPDTEAFFEVDTSLSKRLKAYFKKKNKSLTNKNLILATLNIVLVLDYLLNSRQSPAYTDSPAVLFRSEGNLGFIPVYSTLPVSAPDTDTGGQQKGKETDPDTETGDIDVLSGFPGNAAYSSYLLQHMKKAQETGVPFTLLQLETRDYHPDKSSEEKRRIIQQLSGLIGDTIRQFKDIPIRREKDIFAIILPGTELSGALTFTERFFHNTKEILPCFVGIVPYRDSMTIKEIQNAAEKALSTSKSFPAPMLTYTEPENGNLIHTL